jgi:hypothetical protein
MGVVLGAALMWTLGSVAKPGIQAEQLGRQAVPRTQGNTAQSDVDYTREQAEYIVRHLYLALLDREVDPSSLTSATAEVQRGNLSAQISSMTSSQEFTRRIRTKSSAAWLESLYKALLDRTPDSGGVRTYLTNLDQGRYADVLFDMITSTEFENRLPGQLNRRGRGSIFGDPSRGRGPAPVLDPSRAFVACEDAVLDEVRSRANRQLVLRFSQPDISDGRGGADTVRGRATDVLAGDRSLNYRCEMDRSRNTVNRVTVTWDDGQDDAMFQIAIVRACQDAVRDTYRREGGRRDLVFESAGILPLGQNLEAIRGNAREGALFGSGRALDYACEAQRGRVTSATYKYSR